MKKKGTHIVAVDCAGAGDIVSMAGLTNPSIGHTIASVEVMTALPTVVLDPPTISMTFGVNDSPLAGRDGTYLTGRQIGDRLMAETERNLAINVLPAMSDSYEVQGRGELQLGILIENMRREKFEISVSPPKVILSDPLQSTPPITEHIPPGYVQHGAEASVTTLKFGSSSTSLKDDPPAKKIKQSAPNQ